MGYTVKLQKVSRPTNNTFFVTLPVVLVETMDLAKGNGVGFSSQNVLVRGA